ncbi:MAG: transporter, partial [Armatimonadota bacterium]|nr:transporter [Armatimonadota bacterium]
LLEGSKEYGLKRPDVSLIAATTLPTGSSAFGENKLQPGVKLCLAWDLAERLALSANANYDRASEGGERFNQFSASASLGYQLNDKTGSFLEVFGFFPGSNDGPNTKYLDAGLTYLLNDDFQLDARAGIGLNNGPGPDYFLGAGAARRW